MRLQLPALEHLGTVPVLLMQPYAHGPSQIQSFLVCIQTCFWNSGHVTVDRENCYGMLWYTTIVCVHKCGLGSWELRIGWTALLGGWNASSHIEIVAWKNSLEKSQSGIDPHKLVIQMVERWVSKLKEPSQWISLVNSGMYDWLTTGSCNYSDGKISMALQSF